MIDFEVLAYDLTSLGTLCLRRRLTLSEPQQWVTEVTLNHEFLMSSLHADSEQALAQLALLRIQQSKDLRVLVGGLGMGYTAAAALDDSRVSVVEVVEFLPQVISWLHAELVPLAPRLAGDSRMNVVQGDIYQKLISEPCDTSWNAILIDVDHSPEDRLADDDHGFYTLAGLRQATKHLSPGGVLALWSYEGNQDLQNDLHEVFDAVEVLPVTYHNQHVSESFTDWLFLGQKNL